MERAKSRFDRADAAPSLSYGALGWVAFRRRAQTTIDARVMRTLLALTIALARAREARTQDGRNILFMMVDDGGFESPVWGNTASA